MDFQCRHEFWHSNAWTALTDVPPKELRWLLCTGWTLGWCRMLPMPVSVQSYECCPVVVGWCLMLCHTQCNHSQTWNEHGTASGVCLCPLPISREQPLGWGWEPPCTILRSTSVCWRHSARRLSTSSEWSLTWNALKIEEAMTSAEINAELVCPLRTLNFPPGTHDYDPKRHDLIKWVSKCMISGQEAQAKFNEFREAQRSHDEVYTDGSKINEKVGAAPVINRHFQNGETTCRQLSKRLPDNSTIFAAEATAISLALNYYQHMGPVHHDVVVYSNSMSCLQAIEGEDTEKPFICHIMNLLWSLSDKGTRVRFCWVRSHCGIDGNESVDQLAKETLDQDIDPLASVHYTDMKPLVNSYIQKLVQTKWDVAVHGRDLYLVKPTLGPPKKFQHLTRAEEVVITQLGIGHTKATKSHIFPRTANWLSPLWWNTDHWPYAAGVCIVTGMSWWILHSRLVECSLWDNSWDLLSRIPARSGILLPDMM